jgi:hypothetical protein
MGLNLSSSAFADGERIPTRHTCEGGDISPPLEWNGAPEGTRSYALVCSDPDAPVGTWYHWAVFDIAPETARLDEAFATDARVGTIRQALTDFRRTGYGGPCPPKGHGVHRYRFHLMAVDSASLSLPESPDCRDVERAAKEHLLAETTLTGTYSR